MTLEHGVRVFRPLPPHERVIINPGGQTPLHLGYEQHTSTSHNHFYGGGTGNSDSSYGGSGGYGNYGFVPGYAGWGYGRAHPGHRHAGRPVYRHHGAPGRHGSGHGRGGHGGGHR